MINKGNMDTTLSVRPGLNSYRILYDASNVPAIYVYLTENIQN